MTLTVAVLAGLLYAVGTWLVLQRRLTRIIIGLGMMGHGANLLLIQASAGRDDAPFVSDEATSTLANTTDPLPQALALTAIVITFGVTALLLALAYRSWVLTRDDLVEDDVEDRRIARRGSLDEELADQRAAETERLRNEASP
ncbi:MAG: sodium:proton antiporter [Acidimicrobiales bacterium]